MSHVGTCIMHSKKSLNCGATILTSVVCLGLKEGAGVNTGCEMKFQSLLLLREPCLIRSVALPRCGPEIIFVCIVRDTIVC